MSFIGWTYIESLCTPNMKAIAQLVSDICPNMCILCHAPLDNIGKIQNGRYPINEENLGDNVSQCLRDMDESSESCSSFTSF